MTLIKLGSTNKGGLFYQGGEKIVGESKTQVVKGENKKEVTFNAKGSHISFGGRMLFCSRTLRTYL